MDVLAIERQDHVDLQNAKYLLENPGLIAKATNLIGKPIQGALKALPTEWSNKIGDVTQKALEKAADAALFTIKDIPNEKASNIWHKVGVALSGAAGGALGLPALAAELPLSTTIILRSILDIARGEGESISSDGTKLECLAVFGLGSPDNGADDDSEIGYYAARQAMAKMVTEATQVLAKNAGQALTKDSSSVLLKFLAAVAERFSITVSEKAAVQAVPVIGAIGGAAINTLFMDHYQDMAKGHFTVRRLERKYGKDSIRAIYASLPSSPTALFGSEIPELPKTLPEVTEAIPQ
jgi:hypothetical protein